ncbi:protein DYAD-like [Ananas comosus]|uniref:Protein DYAD-like n=1 Tax=Ananas comosus TaxID=4615 RepID=A0A6P5GAF8_ANACO|nr:protein DYAD-like [Ananas comosus]
MWGPQVKCYSKRNEPTTVGLKRSALGRQMLSTTYFSHAPPCNGGFEIGAFYEIDHEKLPPKSPIQLKAIRVVKVCETTTLDVTVSFPSNRSLRHYFASQSDERGPELDERFVMSSNHAGKILRRSIPRPQLEGERHLERFWLVTPGSYNLRNPRMSPSSEPGAEDVKSSQKAMSSCLLTLKHSGAPGWGIRRKVKYIGRHRDHLPSSKEEDEVVDCKEVKEDEEKVLSGSGRKRKRPPETSHDRKEAKEPGRLLSGVQEEEGKKRCREGSRVKAGYKERWSRERYQAAELKLLDIMREKGAALGRPILRQLLREEARKHIGDTGLLDHLLKHMAGKVVSQGKERFRRRHNAEGAMEYWLEPAELVEMRRMAGVMDTYWVPPPGWKLGDATSPCPCSAKCQAQLDELRGELMRNLKSRFVTWFS